MEQSTVFHNKFLKTTVKLFTKFPFLFTVFIILSICLICFVLHNLSISQYVSGSIQWDEEGRVLLEAWRGEYCTAVTEPDTDSSVFTVRMTADAGADRKYVYVLDQESKELLDDHFGNSCNVSFVEGKISLLDRVRFYHLTKGRG